ncbi:MAG: superoxide dismutase [Chloroflexota bacterium]|nr:superoxide dismutase [Chloroflexota bacterium]
MKRLTVVMLVALSALIAAAPAPARPFPGVIELPVGWQPEGIATGAGNAFYVGAIPTGAIYRGDLRTGTGGVAVPPRPGRMAAGIKVDARERIFVAGAFTGQAYVHDARTGTTLAEYQLGTPGATMVNDVALTNDAAWLTDSFRAVLYRIPLARNGTLGGQSEVQEVPLTADFELASGFNANGIDATPDGKTLIAVQTNLGRLYRIDPATGAADRIELSGGDVAFGDGLLLAGRTLYVVQNELDRIAVVRLSPDLRSGTIVDHLTHSALDVPATIAKHGNRLYTVNARFGIPAPETAPYAVVQLRP